MPVMHHLLHSLMFFPHLLDIDECVQDWDGCDERLTACVNTPGSFYCACPNPNDAWNGQACVGKCSQKAPCFRIVNPFLVKDLSYSLLSDIYS